MNVHDSERIAGLLDEAGYLPVTPGAQADIVVFNTCAVRENADNKLYGNLSFLAPIKKANPNMQIAVGGCLAQFFVACAAPSRAAAQWSADLCLC
jgi:tRNA-2-methylthio-N6-dimethylallyladenosine synthase